MTKDSINTDIRKYFDFLKAISIIGIVSFHVFNTYLYFAYLSSSSAIINKGIFQVFMQQSKAIYDYLAIIPKTFFSFGFLGVEVFIIASGFGLCLSQFGKPVGWLIFYKKRFIRLIPLYYIFLIVTFVTQSMRRPEYYSSEGLIALAKHFLLVQLFDESYRFYELYYFISLLALLYLTFPLLYKAVNSDRWRVFTLALLVVAMMALEALMGLKYAWGLLKYLPYFYFGMVYAHSLNVNGGLSRLIFNKKLQILSCILLLFSLYAISYFVDYNELMRPLLVLLFFFISPLVYRLAKQFKFMRIVMLLSFSSYVIYLSHLIILRAFSIYTNQWLWTSGEWVIYNGIYFICIAVFSYLVQQAYNLTVKRLTVMFSSPR